MFWTTQRDVSNVSTDRCCFCVLLTLSPKPPLLLLPSATTDTDADGVLSLWEWVHLYKVLSAARAAFSRADAYTTAQLTW
jgi:hypothetical protein